MNIAILVVFSYYLFPVLNASTKDCPLWSNKNETGDCTCGNAVEKIVQCSKESHSIYLKDCFCMTPDPSNTEAVVGYCIFTCSRLTEESKHYLLMSKVNATSLSDLSYETCGAYNREGVMCSKCIKDHGISVNPFNVSCIPCERSGHNWVKYLTVVYIPLTVFVFIIILLRFNANSGAFVTYVMLSQMMANRNFAALYLIMVPDAVKYKIAVAFYTVWNLQFLRPLIPDVCLSPDLTVLQFLALEYLVAVYPMLLVILTLLVVYCHGNSQAVVCLCRPLYVCLHRFRKNWNVGNSLIEAFATLILLTYAEIMVISFNILTHSSYCFANPNRSCKRVVYADPSIEYLSSKHIPYFVLAIIMALIFNVLPLFFVVLFPCHLFQKFLSFIRLNNRTLHTLMDAFRGNYKLKPKCLHSFSAIYILANFCNISIYYTLGHLLYHSGMMFIIVILLLLVTSIAPHKSKLHNRMNSLLILSAFVAIYSVNFYIQNIFFTNIKNLYIHNCNFLLITVGFLALPVYGVCRLSNYLIPTRLKSNLLELFNTKHFHFVMQTNKLVNLLPSSQDSKSTNETAEEDDYFERY